MDEQVDNGTENSMMVNFFFLNILYNIFPLNYLTIYSCFEQSECIKNNNNKLIDLIFSNIFS